MFRFVSHLPAKMLSTAEGGTTIATAKTISLSPAEAKAVRQAILDRMTKLLAESPTDDYMAEVDFLDDVIEKLR